MDIPIRIVFHGLPRADAVEDQVRASAQKLSAYFDFIRSCRVEISRTDGAAGDRYAVGVHIVVPGSVIEIGGHAPRADLATALREACAAAKRPLEEMARRQRGDPMHTSMPSSGHITQLLDGLGFIEAADGRRVSFHRDSCLDPKFDQLTIGDAVHFLAIFGPDGLHAKQMALAKHPVA